MTGRVTGGMILGISAAVMVAAPAIAQAQTYRFDLPAQPLDASLRAFARTTRQQILFDGALVRGKRAPVLKGSYSAEQGLAVLLRGSGLAAVRGRGGAFVVSAVGNGASTDTAGTAPEVVMADAEIVVTGSRIRGTQTPSPTLTRQRDQIAESGASDLGEFARTLTQNFNGGQNPGVRGSQGGSEDTTGSSAFNLRGLGSDATLTLVNGHRSAYDGVFQGVDVSAIPLASVERVEVVTDGASALYGSDAVAGVVNLILRRDFDGIQTSARFGAATDGGAAEQQYVLTGGSRWSGGGAVATIEYNRATPVRAGQRSYTQGDDADATLIPGYRQVSIVVAGHQRLGDWLGLEIDGQYSDRTSRRCSSAVGTLDCRTQGQEARRGVRSFAVTPSLVADLAGGWQATLSGTYARSDTEIVTQVYARGNPTALYLPNYHNSFHAVELGFEGRLFDAPGGAARLAFGGGYRANDQNTDYRQIIGGATTPVWVYKEKRKTRFAYGELALPLVGAANGSAGLRELQLSAALRYEDNSGFGDIATPKVGIIYRPVSDLALRATWGRSFKAPTLFQLGKPLEGYLFPGAIFTPPGGQTVFYLAGGNPALTAEKADTWTATATYTPAFANGLKLEASYFRTRYRDRVVTPISNVLAAFAPQNADYVLLNPSAADVLAIASRLPYGIINQTGTPFDPSNISAIVDSSLANAARQSIQGVDLTATWEGNVSARDRLELASSASYLDSKQMLVEGQAWQDLSGIIFNPPHWRARASLNWKRDAFRFGAAWNYIGKTTDTRFPTTARVGDFQTVDLTAQIGTAPGQAFVSGFSFDMAILNLLNEKPAPIRTSSPVSTPYDSTNHSSLGRTISFTISKKW